MMDWLEFVRKIQDLEKRLGAQERLDRPVPVGVVTRYSGTPAANQVAYWTGAGTVAPAGSVTIENGNTLKVGIDANITETFGVASTTAGIGFNRYVNSAFGAAINFRKSRNATVGSLTTVNNNDELGKFQFLGTDGAAFYTGAIIVAKVDGSPGSADMPTRIEFQVSPDGAATPAAALTIFNDKTIATGGLTSVGASQIGVKAGTSTNDAAVGGVLFVDSGTNANSGSGETDLASYSVPANTLAVNNQFLYFKAWGTFASNANSKTIKAKFGAASHTVFTGITAGGSWSIEGYIIRTGAATQDFMAEGQNTISAPGFVGVGTAAETLSGAVTLKLTGQGGATNDVKQEGFIVEYGDKNT